MQFHWVGRGHRGHAYLIENKRMSQGGPTGDERIDVNHLLVTDDVIIIPFCPVFFFTEGWTVTEGWTENKDFLNFVQEFL